ncbi:hypothetical protein L1999_14250 [Neobacillus drentensis]|uniref:hypothetical protein n=1 Tax=Neobacillus drentensis TaxID=220684 RepID=UPI001F21AA55|nr:hypothetical protein [Neobacillus drentensis]ULT59610.1 hypothetical protein L1999_14250 [Neobacillus drentensis]
MQDKKSSTHIILNGEATLKGSLKLRNGTTAKVELKYSTTFAIYNVVMLYIDGVYVDGVKGI